MVSHDAADDVGGAAEAVVERNESWIRPAAAASAKEGVLAAVRVAGVAAAAAFDANFSVAVVDQYPHGQSPNPSH